MSAARAAIPRVAVAIGAALAVGLWVPIVALGPARWIRIGHGELFGDFLTIYLVQARSLNGSQPDLVPGWLYPPPLAVALRPLVAAGEPVAIGVWWAVLGLAVLGVGVQARRALGGPAREAWPVVAVLLALSAPVLDAIKWGQVSLPLAAVGLWALAAGGRAGAALIGLAAAIKVYPLAWALPAALRGRWREVGLGLGVAVAVIVAASATMGRELVGHMFGAIWFEAGSKDYGPWGGQDIADLLRRWLVRGTVLSYEHPAPLIAPLPRFVGPTAANAAFRLVSLVPLAVTAVRLRRGGDPWLILPALALASPPGWTHAFAFLPAVFAAGIARGGRSRGLAIAGALVGAAPLLGLVVGPTGWNAATAWGATTAAAALGWGALLGPHGASRRG